MTTKPDDEARWVERRAQYLSSGSVAGEGVGFRDRVAEATAWSELGHSRSGIAKKMDVTEGTAKKYGETASDIYPGIRIRMAYEFDYDPEAGVDDLPSPPQDCPVCLADRVNSPGAAEDVYVGVSDWGPDDLLDQADLVCSLCRSVRIDGEWRRMESAGARAHTLAQSGSSSTVEYKERLTAGIDVGVGQREEHRAERPTNDDAEGW